MGFNSGFKGLNNYVQNDDGHHKTGHKDTERG